MSEVSTSEEQGRRWALGIRPDKENREKDDYYPTPPEGIEALLAVERFEGLIWEPACGEGAISEVLKAHGYEVRSTDLVDRGYGTPRVDFLMEYQTAPNIITNPPFKLALEFCEQALALASKKVCMLVRLAFLEGQSRKPFFETAPLARIWVFSKRINCARGGGIPRVVAA